MGFFDDMSSLKDEVFPSGSVERVGILGGTFDPPHIGHLVMAQRALEQLSLDIVFFVPTGIPPHGKKPVASADHRLNMIRLAVFPHKKFDVSDCEIKRGGPSYTVDTVRFFKDEFPSADIFLLIGEDSARNFSNWREPEKILSMVKVAWFPRPNSGKGEIPEFFIKVEAELLDISSTKIREFLREGRSVKYLVPDPVLNYIKFTGIYSDSEEHKRD